MPRPKAAPATASAAPALIEPAAPRFAALWAALVYALCTLALTYPVFAGQFLVSPHSDQYIAGYAFRQFAARSLDAGMGFPNWNPYLFGGMPYIAAMHGDIFYPTFLLRMVMRTDLAMTWEFGIHLFLAGIFTYAFLRAWRMGFFPALVGGLAYMLAGQVASYASPGHDGKLFVSALMPAALWMLTRGIRDGRAYAWGVLSIVIGLAVLSPHPQLLQYMLLTCGAWALWLAFGTQPDGTKLDRAVALRRLGLALAAVVIGAAIGAVQFVPVREYVAWSPRAGGRGYDYATTYSFPIEELFNTYLPQFTGMLDNYWGRNSIHLHSEYLGVVVLMLAFAGMFSARRSFRWFWVGTLIVSLLWALGGNTPFYHLVYALVPGSKFFRAPSTIFYVVSFAIAVLASLGTERLLAGEIRERYGVIWLAVGGVVALLAVSGALTGIAGSIGPSVGNYIAQSYAPEQHDAVVNAVAAQVADRAQANNGDLVAGALRSFLFVLLGVGLLFAITRRKLTPRIVGWALVVVTAADLWSIARHYWIFSPPARQLYATDPAIEAIKAGPPGRVVAEALVDSGVTPRDPYFGGSGLMVHDVRSLTGYHGNELGRYQKLLGYPPGSRPSLREEFNAQIWRHENVRYLYTNVDEPSLNAFLTQSGLPHVTKLAGPVKNSAGSVVYAYAIDADNPLAWVAPVMVKASDDQALPTVTDPRYDPSRVAIVDSAADVPSAQLTALPAPLNVPAKVTWYAPGEVVVKLDGTVPAGSALVVSENYYPGWQASVDGKGATTVRADYNLIGIPLTAGAREIKLWYHDPAYGTGKTITWIALIVAALATLAGVVADRRRTPVPVT